MGERMSQDRLCIIDVAPDAVLEEFLACLDKHADALVLLERDAAFSQGFETFAYAVGAVRQSDTTLREAFCAFKPTDVIIVCDRYAHDDVVDMVLTWSQTVGTLPRILVYQNNILHEGYLEVVRKHPGLAAAQGRG